MQANKKSPVLSCDSQGNITWIQSLRFPFVVSFNKSSYEAAGYSGQLEIQFLVWVLKELGAKVRHSWLNRNESLVLIYLENTYWESMRLYKSGEICRFERT